MLDRLDESTIAALVEGAREAATRAYSPYSNFPVGAAVLTAQGAIVTGCNIENASYGLTVCAERVAVWSAIKAGAGSIQAVAVVAPKGRGATPCGACRQVLNEFRPADGDLIIVLDGEAGPEQIGLSALLPRAFGPRQLEPAEK